MQVATPTKIRKSKPVSTLRVKKFQAAVQDGGLTPKGFRWQPGTGQFRKVNAGRVGREAFAYAKRYGGDVNYIDLEQELRDKPGKAIHQCLEWDNEVAGSKHRQRQLMQIFNSLEVEYIEVPRKHFTAFVHIDKKHTYRATSKVFAEEDSMAKLVGIAKKELVNFDRKYKTLVRFCAELRPVLSAIRKFVG